MQSILSLLPETLSSPPLKKHITIVICSFFFFLNPFPSTSVLHVSFTKGLAFLTFLILSMRVVFLRKLIQDHTLEFPNGHLQFTTRHLHIFLWHCLNSQPLVYAPLKSMFLSNDVGNSCLLWTFWKRFYNIKKQIKLPIWIISPKLSL